MNYLVSRQGVAQGPFAIDEIVSKVRAKELELFDYVYDEGKADWVLLMEFPQLADRLKSTKPPRPTPHQQDQQQQQAPASNAQLSVKTDVHAMDEWYVMKGENRFGPFSYIDLVKMMQQKVIFPFDHVWHAGLDSWKRVAQFSEFDPEAIRTLYNKQGKGKGLFSERKFKRHPYEGNVLVHDNLTLWKGKGFEISRGGVGISMQNSLVIPGQKLVVHFKTYGEWQAFNAVCEVVSKKFVNDDSPVQYGLRFLSMTQDVQTELFTKVA